MNEIIDKKEGKNKMYVQKQCKMKIFVNKCHQKF